MDESANCFRDFWERCIRDFLAHSRGLLKTRFIEGIAEFLKRRLKVVNRGGCLLRGAVNDLGAQAGVAFDFCFVHVCE